MKLGGFFQVIRSKHGEVVNFRSSGGRIFDGDIKIEWEYHVQFFYVFSGIPSAMKMT